MPYNRLSSYEHLLKALMPLVGRDIEVSVGPRLKHEVRPLVAIFHGTLERGVTGGPLFPGLDEEDDGPFGGEWTSWSVVSDTGEPVGLFVTGRAAFRGGVADQTGRVSWLVAPDPPETEDPESGVEVRIKPRSLPWSKD